MNKEPIPFPIAATAQWPESIHTDESLARVCFALERLRAGEPVAVLSEGATEVRVDLIVPEMANTHARQQLARLGCGPLRLVVSPEDPAAVAAIDLARLGGWMGGVVTCEIADRVVAPLRTEPLECWADAFGIPVLTWLDIIVATATSRAVQCRVMDARFAATSRPDTRRRVALAM